VEDWRIQLCKTEQFLTAYRMGRQPLDRDLKAGQCREEESNGA